MIIFSRHSFNIPLIVTEGYDVALGHGTDGAQSDGMAHAKINFTAWALDELWALHEEISGILSVRIRAEKGELEKRLATLTRGIVAGDPENLRPDGKPRRRYPRVLPKYRNPDTSETWSGRGGWLRQ